MPPPDLVLYLTADVDTCIERVQARQRSFEQRSRDDYLAELIDAYNHYFHYYNRSPLLVVDTRHIDFVNRSEDFEDLVKVLAKPVKGTEYYVPLGSRKA